jgi:hypothetical protein
MDGKIVIFTEQRKIYSRSETKIQLQRFEPTRKTANQLVLPNTWKVLATSNQPKMFGQSSIVIIDSRLENAQQNVQIGKFCYCWSKDTKCVLIRNHCQTLSLQKKHIKGIVIAKYRF